LLILLAAAALFYVVVLIRTGLARGVLKPTGESIVVGGAVNFLDALGIGSFAPTLSWLKFRTNLPARSIPCTMIVACTIPTILQAAIFLALLGVHVDPLLLAGYAVALLLGGLAGARVVTWAPIWLVQGVVAAALMIAAALYALSNLHMMPAGGAAGSLPLALMIVVMVTSFTMGVLLNFGVGHYAPSLLVLSLMGMDPRLVFPIMATGGALTVAVVSARHIRVGVADIRIALGFAIGGVPAVLVAALIVKDMPVEWLRWLVIAVVVYAAAIMLREAVTTFRQQPLGGDDIALAAAEGLTD
jgi:uncharacterized membrane protein YfcA